ncbi:MAG: type II secretion system F family protein [Victivallaceae bacterium]|nr:type II secretion system F family protein [Victivallaceae bacterium]
MIIVLMCALAFLVVVLPVVYFVYLFDPVRPATDDRLKSLPPVFRIAFPLAKALNRIGYGGLVCSWFPSVRTKREEQLAYCRFPITVSELFSVQLVVGLAVGVVMMLFGIAVKSSAEMEALPVLGLMLGLMVGYALPSTKVAGAVDERRTAIFRALPYSVDLIASAMRGGLDFSAAVRFYVNLGGDSPLTDEYRQMLRDMELGVSRMDALQDMADRVGIKEFHAMVSAIIMGTELGASLSDTMAAQGEDMRQIRFAEAERKAQRAPSLMLIPMALFIMPAVFIVILTPILMQFRGF